MYSAITNDICVSVDCFYEATHSNPDASKFVFSYHVNIENLGHSPVQLLSRHWIITDATLTTREVVGEGVIGEQPIIEPGKSHSYNSWCPLPTDTGKMHGTYQMINTITEEKFDINIPVFKMIADYKLN